MYYNVTAYLRMRTTLLSVVQPECEEMQQQYTILKKKTNIKENLIN